VFGEGVPSDRVFAEWWVNSAHVEAALSGQRPQVDRVEGHVTIPEDVDAVHRNSIDEHLRWRLRVRQEFATELARGMIARGFERDSANARSRYLFAADQEQFTFGAYTGVQAAGTSAQ
jgi:predicted GNAT superfamily acetyltransferase